MGLQTAPPTPTANTPVEHHFLPIFYQSAWAGADDRVVRYSRPYDKVVAKACAPRRTGSMRNLYTHTGVPPQLRAYLETEFFSPVDSNAALAHRALLEGGVSSVTPDQRVHWARYMMSSQMRSPFTLDELWRLADQSLRQNMAIPDAEYDAVRKAGDPATLYDWMAEKHPQVNENIHKTWLPNMIDQAGLGTYLINMDWSVLDLSSASRRLLTGDRPLIATHGWKHPQTTLLFPLSPTQLFTATNGRPQTASLLRRSPAFFARNANDQIVRCAVDVVIGDTDAHLEFVERRLRRPGKEPVPGPIGRGRPNCPA